MYFQTHDKLLASKKRLFSQNDLCLAEGGNAVDLSYAPHVQSHRAKAPRSGENPRNEDQQLKAGA